MPLRRFIGPALGLLFMAPASALPQSSALDLRVVYPAPEDRVRVRDSSFLLGSVAGGDVRLTINGNRVRVWPNGAWLAWLPFPPESVMQFHIAARRGRDSTVITYPVRRDPRFIPGLVNSGGAWIDTMSLSPRGQAWIGRSEYLTLTARAVEGASVRVHLPDGSTVRLQPQRQPEEVLPAIRAFEHDTAKLRTPDEVRYVGVIRGKALGPDPGPILRGPSRGFLQALARAVLRCVTGGSCPTPYSDLLSPDAGWAVIEVQMDEDVVRARWPLQVSLLDSLPVVTEFDDDTTGTGRTDSLTPGRAVPGGPYQWFFPTGTRASVTGRVNEDIRIRLSPESETWVPAADARPLPAGVPAPHAVVGSVMVTSRPDRATLRLPLTQRVPFQITEGERSLTVKLYSAVGDIDWIRYATDTLIQRLSSSQTGTEELTFTVDLRTPVWGYRARWDRNDLLLEIRRPPAVSATNPLRGRRIALDPGHPPLGATGPTGLRESDANLAVALILRRLLQQAGARVFMTRTADTAVDLWARVALADSSGAELLVSIHNNALPDGVNPFTNNGTSVFYNQPRSLPLAAEIQKALVRRLGLTDLGISRADLALIRPTWLPSALSEGMFVILPDQEARLRSAAGQRQYARGVLEGIRNFLQSWSRRPATPGVGQLGSEASPRTQSTKSRSPAGDTSERDVVP